MSPATRTAYLGLGSNIGDRRAHLLAAVDALPRHGVSVTASSSTYETEPVGCVLDQPDFLNACLRAETTLGPEDLLDACKATEAEVGRSEAGVRHGPRVIDVDVLLLDELVYTSPRLTLPHREVSSRRFVMLPLLELDSRLALPDGTPLHEPLAALGASPPKQGVRRAGPSLL